MSSFAFAQLDQPNHRHLASLPVLRYRYEVYEQSPSRSRGGADEGLERHYARLSTRGCWRSLPDNCRFHGRPATWFRPAPPPTHPTRRIPCISPFPAHFEFPGAYVGHTARRSRERSDIISCTGRIRFEDLPSSTRGKSVGPVPRSCLGYLIVSSCPSFSTNALPLFSGPDAFQPDPESLHLSPEPLIKAATQLMALINSLCAMLQTSPFHRENYSRLILGVVIQFYQRCSDRFQTLTSTGPVGSIDAQVALAAQWAQRSELQPPLSELRKISVCVLCSPCNYL